MAGGQEKSLDAHVPIVFETGTDEAFFDALRGPWEQLDARCGKPSLFMSWQWQRLWWAHYGAGRRLHLLVARDDERLLGVMPMYLERGRLGRFPVRRLRSLGSGGDTAPDDLDPLLHPEFEEYVAQGFARRILKDRSEWDETSCTDLDPAKPFTRAFAEATRATPRVLLRGSKRHIVRGDLPTQWDDYLTRLGPHRRKGLRRKLRRFEAEPGASVTWHRGAAQVDAAFDRLVRLHHLRWQGRAESHAFASSAYLGFHRQLMHWLDETGALRLLELRARGQVFAMRYGYRWRDTFYDLQGGFDPAFADLSPGELGLSLAIEQAIREGCSAFDMLRGDYEHKRGLFKEQRSAVDLHVYRGPLMLGFVLGRDLVVEARRGLKALVERARRLTGGGRQAWAENSGFRV